MQTAKGQHDGMSIELAADWSGQGPLVLLLPALSSISTRREMRPLQERLRANYRTVSIDWPGFGDQPRARHDWRPEIYSDFLSYLTGTVLPPVHAVIAAGQAATFALLHACAHPGSFKRLVLVAPTWRGPLPTMMDPTAAVRSHLQTSGSADHRAGALPTKCEPACHSLHGHWTRLYGFCLAARRTIA